MQEPKKSFSRLGSDLGDTKVYDKAYDNAKNLFKDYVKKPVDVKYEQKDIDISYRIQNGILGKYDNVVKIEKQIHKIRKGKAELFLNTPKSKENKDKIDNNFKEIVKNGLSLLASRNDVFGPAYSYPKTFVIKDTDSDEVDTKTETPISHIRDIHRIILINAGPATLEDKKNKGQINMIVTMVDVIDLFHNASKINNNNTNQIDIPSSCHKFLFFTNSKTGKAKLTSLPGASTFTSITGKGGFFDDNNAFRNEILSDKMFDITYTKINKWKNAITNNTSSMFNISKNTTTHTFVDEMLIKNDEYDTTSYTNPQSDLAIAALYITDFYMRNQELPEQNADKVTSYLLNNFDDIEALTRVSMYIGKFPITAPIEDEQYEYTIPSGQLDDQKFLSIDEYLNKDETRKALGIKNKINSNMTPQMLLAKKMLKIQKLQNEIEYLKKNPVITTTHTIESKNQEEDEVESEKEELGSNISSNDFIDNLSQFSEEE